MSCPDCNGSGWVPRVQPRADGAPETSFRLCGCNTPDGPIPFPMFCRAARCRAIISRDEALCKTHRAAWNAEAGREEHEHAAGVLDALADAYAKAGLPTVEDAIRGAADMARVSAAFYESERDRIERGA